MVGEAKLDRGPRRCEELFGFAIGTRPLLFRRLGSSLATTFAKKLPHLRRWLSRCKQLVGEAEGSVLRHISSGFCDERELEWERGVARQRFAQIAPPLRSSATPLLESCAFCTRPSLYRRLGSSNATTFAKKLPHLRRWLRQFSNSRGIGPGFGGSVD